MIDKGASYLLGRGLNFALPVEQAGLSPDAAQRPERLLYGSTRTRIATRSAWPSTLPPD